MLSTEKINTYVQNSVLPSAAAQIIDFAAAEAFHFMQMKEVPQIDPIGIIPYNMKQ